MPDIKHAPYPYFILNRELDVIQCSDSGRFIFEQVSNFLDLVDVDSKNKAATLLQGEIQGLELVLKTNDSPVSLFSCAMKWEKDVGHMICLPQDNSIKELSSLIQEHRNRLAETNFELLVKKEEVEASYKVIKELSAPFIKLSDKMALVPLFGDLDKELLTYTNHTIMSYAYDTDYEKVLFDFSGIRKVTTQGMDELSRLITSLVLMGVRPYISGMKPDHARVMKDDFPLLDIQYISNLSNVLLHSEN